jgi:hypothetical protein
MTLRSLLTFTGRGILLLILLSVLGGGTLQAGGTRASVRAFTRPLEFDFVQWTVDALAIKVGQYGLDSAGYVQPDRRTEIVRQAMSLLEDENKIETELQDLYGQPALQNRDQLIRQKSAQLAAVNHKLSGIQATAETILEEQMAVVLSDLGLDIGGKSFPPISFHFSELPYALIVSPRTVIRQDANVQLRTDLSLAERIALEQAVESGLDVSALVVPVGGYGTYPTMVQQSSALDWVTEVVAHEWTHNYLTLRPLGLRYEVNDDLRTMNETTASLLGRAIGRQVLLRYYPDLVPPAPAPTPAPQNVQPSTPPAFDFRAEMRETRVRVDELLAAGKVDEAEAYMETRRRIFWDHGFHIRRLNQAYFAFHGSYAAEPGGAAGDDPVGEAVRALWNRMDDPVAFLRQMAWMSGTADLAKAVGHPIGQG